MSLRSGLSQVKLRVRSTALLLHEFTAAAVVQATGLNPESVRTELQRMKKEGFLESCPSDQATGKRGARPVLYRIADDPERALALAKTIEAFYPPRSARRQPSSRYYPLAVSRINQAQSCEDGPARDALLEEALESLERANQAEGGEFAPALVLGYLQYESARVAYLRRQYHLARVMLERLRPLFAGDTTETQMLKRVDDLAAAVDLAESLSAATVPDEQTRHVDVFVALDVLKRVGPRLDSPYVALIADLLKECIALGQRPHLAESAWLRERRPEAVGAEEAVLVGDLRHVTEPVAPLVSETVTHSPTGQLEHHCTFMATVSPANGKYVASCLGLGVPSQGSDPHEALMRLQEAITLYLRVKPSAMQQPAAVLATVATHR